MLNLTHHASQRAAQRSMKLSDLEIVLRLGTEVADGYLMRDSDCQAAVRMLMQEMQRIKRLRGKRVVVKEGIVVTVYHASERETSRILRRTHECNLEDAA